MYIKLVNALMGYFTHTKLLLTNVNPMGGIFLNTSFTFQYFEMNFLFNLMAEVGLYKHNFLFLQCCLQVFYEDIFTFKIISEIKYIVIYLFKKTVMKIKKVKTTFVGFHLSYQMK